MPAHNVCRGVCVPDRFLGCILGFKLTLNIFQNAVVVKCGRFNFQGLAAQQEEGGRKGPLASHLSAES